jgi:carnosine N-methyltransferase
MIDWDLITCLKCENPLRVIKTQSVFKCDQCSTTYPIVNGEIPILVSNPNRYLATKLAAFYNFKFQFLERIQNIKIVESSSSKSRGLYKDFVKASMSFYYVMRDIYEVLEEHVSLEELSFYSRNEFDVYDNTYGYLKRDWSGLPEYESELKTIIQAIGKHPDSSSQVGLVLGAGTGRIAHELSQNHNQLYAFDSSLLFVSLYKKIFQTKLKFYEFETRNRIKSSGFKRRITADIAVASHDQRLVKIFLANAEKIPLRSTSIDVIYSVYFTDVIPLPILLKEVKRLLKNKGRFFHFGPLQYGFDQIEYHFAVDEIKDILLQEGFLIEKEGFVDLTHNYRSNSMAQEMHKAWYFEAVLKS